MRLVIAMVLVVVLSACQSEPKKGEAEDMNMNQSLIEHAEQGNTERVKELLQAGAAINATDEAGRTAVMAAAYNNHIETVQLLIEEGRISISGTAILIMYFSMPVLKGSLRSCDWRLRLAQIRRSPTDLAERL